MAQEEKKRRGYAVGVQMFDWIRERGSMYVDKTEYVWKMVSTDAVNFFLSRPRRFGKSLLIDTLRCYFEGRKELFEGLYIYDKEKEWRQYPVIRLDLSNGKYYEKERVHGTISSILRDHEKRWKTTVYDEYNYDDRLKNIIHAAYEQTGQKVVILIDEYDAPMLDSITNWELQDYIRDRIRNLFSPLKAQAQYLRFVFLTGISKFSQLSVFSELNNLQQLTFDPAYEAVCGITHEEMLTQLKPDIELLMETLNRDYARYQLHYSYEDIVSKLKEMYDGYHFSDHFTDVYCPWSLVNAFAMKRIMNFWFSTGTPTMLVNVMRQHSISLQQIEHISVNLRRFDAPTERISDPIPVLFQSGYLTLKSYNPLENEYELGFPNGEVREGFAYSLYKYYMEDYVGSDDALGNAFKRLRRSDITFEQFVDTIRRWYAGIPYSITDKNQNEQLYQSLIYAALMAFGADVQAEDQTSDGRMDIALKLPQAIYILELKYGKSADKATDQIITKDYAVRFAADSRPVWAVGMNISEDRRTIDQYKIVQVK
ncbi:MAG: AAA family ATPase [Prevotella sp.]|nr:AAA family ATPase [Prevotella sp.]MBR6128879.1 AAA family ATPase [Bacteroidaceae bacterium]